MNQEYAEYRARNPKKDKRKYSDPAQIKPLTIEDIQGTLAILVAGYLLAFVVFLIEKMISETSKKARKMKHRCAKKDNQVKK